VSVTAKIKCNTKSLVNMGSQYEAVTLGFSADYANGKNKEWASATPTLNLQMTVKPEVGELFAFGQSYTLTFDEETADNDA
jgi:hypothetical protein